MKIKLNVRINFTKDGKVFTVWPRPNKFLPGIEFYTGHGTSIAEAVEDLLRSLPEEFTIDDEFAIKTSSIVPQLIRPFEIIIKD